MSKLLLVRDDKFQKHLTPDLHPESPQRLQAIDQAFNKSALDHGVRQAGPRMASEDEIARVHDSGYVEELERLGKRAMKGEFVQLDSDTFMSPSTFDIAKLAAGAGLVGVDGVLEQGHASSFVAVRPPGHHALVDRPMGFCLFNNVAVAARFAQEKFGLKRILIVDWDVHHGNGTQDIFYDDPSVCFVSFHQYPFWPPDTGWLTEDGQGEGKGFNINIPLPAGTGDRGYLAAWEQIVAPIGLEYKPDLIMLSAGYDGHMYDPLGGQRISTAGFGRLTQKLLRLSTDTNAKLVCFLEGGYNTKSLSQSAITTMRVLQAEHAREAAETDILELMPDLPWQDETRLTQDRNAAYVDDRIKALRKHFRKYWQSLRTKTG